MDCVLYKTDKIHRKLPLQFSMYVHTKIIITKGIRMQTIWYSSNLVRIRIENRIQYNYGNH